MKKSMVLLSSALVIAGWVSGASAKTNLTPFTDNLNVHFSNFFDDTIFDVTYLSNNGINITGDSMMDTLDSNNLVTISSKNLAASGYPSMTLVYPYDGEVKSCHLSFVDGPLVLQLAYQYSNPPVCDGITVGNITRDGLYSYNLTITSKE